MPALIKHPVPDVAFMYPDPENEPPPPVGDEVEVEVVVVEPPDFGKYLMPVDGQLEVVPPGATGMKSPV